jgi:hypothetical protein
MNPLLRLSQRFAARQVLPTPKVAERRFSSRRVSPLLDLDVRQG